VAVSLENSPAILKKRMSAFPTTDFESIASTRDTIPQPVAHSLLTRMAPVPVSGPRPTWYRPRGSPRFLNVGAQGSQKREIEPNSSCGPVSRTMMDLARRADPAFRIADRVTVSKYPQ